MNELEKNVKINKQNKTIKHSSTVVKKYIIS